MADSLAVRVGRIVSGGVHAVVDAIEGAMPDAVLRQAIREADQVIDDVRAELGRAIARRHLAAKRLTELSSRHEELGLQIERAIAEGGDDLARAAIDRQLDIEAQVPVLEASVTEAHAAERELEGYVAALEAKRREMDEAASALAAARAEGEAQAHGPAGADRNMRRAAGAFDRVLGRTGAPPVGGVDRERDGRIAELDRRLREQEVSSRLAEIRARAAGAE